MHSREIIKELKANGWERVGGRGDHQKFRHKDFREHVTVPHPVKDIPKGTLQNIRKQAGLTAAQG